MKRKCQICGKRIDHAKALSFGIWNYICQSCWDKQIYLKNKRKIVSREVKGGAKI